MTDDTKTTDFEEITERRQETWSTGDFTQIARQNVVMAEARCDAADPGSSQHERDIACRRESAVREPGASSSRRRRGEMDHFTLSLVRPPMTTTRPGE